MSCWNEFLETDIGQLLVPDWKHEMDNISTYFEVTCDSNDFQEPSTDEREEWMFLADLYSKNPQMESVDSELLCNIGKKIGMLTQMNKLEACHVGLKRKKTVMSLKEMIHTNK